jgi:hypothetical protein
MRRWRWVVAMVSVLALLGTGCSDDDETADTGDTEAGDTDDSSSTTAGEPTTTRETGTAPAAELELTAADFTFDAGGVTEIPAGPVVVTLSNEGEQDHQAGFTRFKDGKTLEDLIGMGEDLSQLDDILEFFGGPNGAAPGGSVVDTVELEPGSYNLMCFIPDPADGQPHVAKGQLLPIEVTEPTEAAGPFPEAPETVTLDDYEFEVPDGFTGEGSVAIENVGEQPHELAVYRAADGKTADDIITFLTADPTTGETAPPGPPPMAGSTGIAATDPGTRNVVELDLTPGEYLFICFIPDVETGAPHFLSGMVRAVTVE